MPSAGDPEQRRRRRAVLKAHHPDLGGDPEEFVRVLAALEGTGPAPRPPGDEVRFARRQRGLGRVTAWYRGRRRPPRVI